MVHVALAGVSSGLGRTLLHHFVEQGKKHGGFFQTSLIRLTEDMDNLGLKSDAEREEFMRLKMEEWEKNKFVRRGYAKYVFTPIIVDKKGSKDKFRICFNF